MGQTGEIRRNLSVCTANHPDLEPGSLKGDHFGLVQTNTGIREEGEGPWQTQEDHPGC